MFNGKLRLAMPANDVIARFLGAALGGALLGNRLIASAPMVGAVAGAILGAAVVTLRTRHAY